MAVMTGCASSASSRRKVKRGKGGGVCCRSAISILVEKSILKPVDSGEEIPLTNNVSGCGRSTHVYVVVREWEPVEWKPVMMT
jgi:hypothetical protein